MRRAASSLDYASKSSAGAEVEADPDVFSPGQDKKEKVPSSSLSNFGGSFSFSNYWGQAASFLENVGEVVSSVSDYVAPLSDTELDESRGEGDEEGERERERSCVDGKSRSNKEEEDEEGERGSFFRAGSSAFSSSHKSSNGEYGCARQLPASTPSSVIASVAVPMSAQSNKPQALPSPMYDVRFTPHLPRAPVANVASAALSAASSVELSDVSLGSPHKSPQNTEVPLHVVVRARLLYKLKLYAIPI